MSRLQREQFKQAIELNRAIIEPHKKTFLQTVDIYTGALIVYMVDRVAGLITQVNGENFKGFVPPEKVEEYLNFHAWESKQFKKLL